MPHPMQIKIIAVVKIHPSAGTTMTNIIPSPIQKQQRPVTLRLIISPTSLPTYATTIVFPHKKKEHFWLIFS